MKTCTTHHHACACREAKATMDMALLRNENEALKASLQVLTDAINAGYMLMGGRAYFKSRNGIPMIIAPKPERIIRKALLALQKTPSASETKGGNP